MRSRQLARASYDDDKGCLEVRSKTGPGRLVVLEGVCRDHLEGWLSVRGNAPGPMFLTITSHGSCQLGGIAPSTVNRLLAKRCRQAGIIGLTPHEVRGGFMRHLRAAGRELDGLRCSFYRTEEGRSAWVVTSLVLA